MRFWRHSFKANRPSLLISMLLSMGLLDEIVAGFPVVGLPLLRDHFHLNYAQSGLLFTIGAFSGLIFDPIINLLSDRGSKRWWILWGLVCCAATYVFTGLAPNYPLLLLAFIFMAPASEAAIGLSQAALVDIYPGKSSWVMARWVLLGGIGDVLAPFVIAGIAFLHFGWTALCILAATLWIIPALIIELQPFPHTQTNHEDDWNEEQNVSSIGLIAGFRVALRNPELLRWAALTVVPTMVDEMFLAFVALYLHDILHASEATIGLIVGIHMVGALLGLFILDRFLLHRFKARHLLIYLSLVVLIAMIVFLTIHQLWVATLSLFIIGMFAANWYPLAKGEAYSTLPGRTGTVRAVVSLFNILDVVLPGLVGIVAGRFGILAGISVLGTAPILMLVLLGPKKISLST